MSTTPEKDTAEVEADQPSVFMDYNCSQFDQSARSRYHLSNCGETEHVCDYLLRLSCYARTAQILFVRGGADVADHVEHFLLNSGDDDLIYP